MFASGGYIIHLFYPFLCKLLSGHHNMSFGTIVATIVFPVIGVVIILEGIFFERINSNLKYKRSKSVALRTYNFTDDGIETIVNTEYMNQQDFYKYDLMTGYYEMNNSLYIKLAIDKQKFYLIIHNYGYTSGSKEEVIALLESKGIIAKLQVF